MDLETSNYGLIYILGSHLALSLIQGQRFNLKSVESAIIQNPESRVQSPESTTLPPASCILHPASCILTPYNFLNLFTWTYQGNN